MYGNRFPFSKSPLCQFDYIENTIYTKGPNYNKFRYQNSFLINVCIANNLYCVDYLINNYNIDILYRNSKGNSALYYSVIYNNYEITKILIDYIIENNHNTNTIFQQNKIYNNPLSQSSKYKDAKILSLFLDKFIGKLKCKYISTRVIENIIKYGDLRSFKKISKFYNFEQNHMIYLDKICGFRYTNYDGYDPDILQIFDIIISNVNVSFTNFITIMNKYCPPFVCNIFIKNLDLYKKVDNFWEKIAHNISYYTSNIIIKTFMDYGMNYDINKSNILNILMVRLNHINHINSEYRVLDEITSKLGFISTIRMYVDPNNYSMVSCSYKNNIFCTPLLLLFINLRNISHLGYQNIYNILLKFIDVFGASNINFNSQIKSDSTFHNNDFKYVSICEISTGNTPLTRMIRDEKYKHNIIKIFGDSNININSQIKNDSTFQNDGLKYLSISKISIGDTPLIMMIKNEIYCHDFIKILAKYSNIEISNEDGLNVLDVLLKQIDYKYKTLIRRVCDQTNNYKSSLHTKIKHILLSIFKYTIKDIQFDLSFYVMVLLAGRISKIHSSKFIILIFLTVNRYIIPCEMINNIIKYL